MAWHGMSWQTQHQQHMLLAFAGKKLAAVHDADKIGDVSRDGNKHH
jgi:hypothetical protein